MRRWEAVARHPALHFVVLGGLVFAASTWMPARVEHASGPPRTDEQILLDEALAIGLDRSDRLVRDRLAGLARLADAGAVEDAAALEREARRLGLAAHDVVVRRHLVQVMELALSRGGPHHQPTDEELAAYLERHRERFLQPPRLRFSHVFFARDRAGIAALPAAQAALARLTAHPSDTTGIGDGFLGGTGASGSGPELVRAFGPAFVGHLGELPVGRWAGPIESAYGWHVVRLDERSPATLPSLAAVRGQLLQAMRADASAARLEQRLAELRRREREGRS
jgi:hypothetical protein